MKAAGEDNLVFDLELNLVLVVFDQETILVLVVFEIVRRLLQAFVAEEEVVLYQSQEHY